MQYLYTEILEGLRTRPGMYFRPPLFPALCNYVQGCEDTLHELAPQHPILSELHGFNDWLLDQFKIASFPPKRWHQIISEREADDAKRVQFFAELFLEYRQLRAKDYDDQTARQTNPYHFCRES